MTSSARSAETTELLFTTRDQAESTGESLVYCDMGRRTGEQTFCQDYDGHSVF